VNKLGRPIEIVGTYKRILVPLDFSEYSKAGLRYAITLAGMFNASITIQHVFESFPHPMIHMHSADSQIVINTVSKSEAETTIKNAVSQIDPDFKRYNMVVTEGRSYREIIKCVEDTEIDLVVMSTRGQGALESFFIGTTADKVIRKVNCPVLAVKEHERDFI
jgi:nucleotide-binding universal stress UspA family protein